MDQLRLMGGKNALAAEAAARLAGLAVFDWDWQTALALVHGVPGTGSRLSLLIRCIALAMAGRSSEARNLLDAAHESPLHRAAAACSNVWRGVSSGLGPTT